MNEFIAATLVVLAATVLFPHRADAADSIATRCPAYTAHLLKAKAYLENKDQDDAVSELKRAQKALTICIREAAEESSEGTRLASAAWRGR